MVTTDTQSAEQQRVTEGCDNKADVLHISMTSPRPFAEGWGFSENVVIITSLRMFTTLQEHLV